MYSLSTEIDYAPTYLDIAGIEKPDYMVGTSLVPLFGGGLQKIGASICIIII